jgi:hypothetical protein
MGDVGWNGGSPKQACDDGGLVWEKVTDGVADGRSLMEKVWT